MLKSYVGIFHLVERLLEGCLLVFQSRDGIGDVVDLGAEVVIANVQRRCNGVGIGTGGRGGFAHRRALIPIGTANWSQTHKTKNRRNSAGERK